MVSPELWLMAAGGIAIGGGVVHWFRPFLTHQGAGLEVDVERLTRFDLIVGRLTGVLIAGFGVLLLSVGLF